MGFLEELLILGALILQIRKRLECLRSCPGHFLEKFNRPSRKQ
jgi:hypothetical protein